MVRFDVLVCYTHLTVGQYDLLLAFSGSCSRQSEIAFQPLPPRPVMSKVNNQRFIAKPEGSAINIPDDGSRAVDSPAFREPRHLAGLAGRLYTEQQPGLELVDARRKSSFQYSGTSEQGENESQIAISEAADPHPPFAGCRRCTK
jgi:hypothetical protein